MMGFVREGDVLYITKLDRLARSVIDLHNIAKFLQNKDVNLKVLHQNIDTTSPAGRLLFTMLGAIAEFERDLINERVREGIEAAKKKGVQFGRKAILDAKNGWTWPPITEILGQIKRFYLDTKNGKYLDTFLDKPLNQFYLS